MPDDRAHDPDFDALIQRARDVPMMEAAERVGAVQTTVIGRNDAKAAGLSKYFTGKCCPNGHLSERFVSNFGCEECIRTRPRDREVTRKQERTRYHSNPDKAREKNRLKEKRRRERNGDHIRAAERARLRKFREENRVEWRKRRRAAYRRALERDPEGVRAKNKAIYSRIEPEKRRVAVRRYRARKRQSEGSHTPADVAAIRTAQKDRCGCCRKRLKGRGEVDHIIPLSNGGSNGPRNLQLLCKPCNNSKNARDAIEFMQSRGFLL